MYIDRYLIIKDCWINHSYIDIFVVMNVKQQFLFYCSDRSLSFRAFDGTWRSSNVTGDDECSKRSTNSTLLEHVKRALGNRNFHEKWIDEHVKQWYEHVFLTARPILLSSSRSRPCSSCMSSPRRKLSPCSLLRMHTRRFERALFPHQSLVFFFLSYFTLFLLTNISSFQSVRIRLDGRVFRTEETSIDEFASKIATVRRNGAFVVGPNAISLVTFFLSFCLRKVR